MVTFVNARDTTLSESKEHRANTETALSLSRSAKARNATHGEPLQRLWWGSLSVNADTELLSTTQKVDTSLNSDARWSLNRSHGRSMHATRRTVVPASSGSWARYLTL
jgi:hypothetical protein